MRLTWYGHAAFRIEVADCAIITDPYNYPKAGGYEPIAEPADLVTISHENPVYHSDTSSIVGTFELINGLDILDEPCERLGVRFSSCLVYEDAEGNGPNTMMRVEAAGITIVHMGDCGHSLDGQQMAFLRDVDVLLAPAGGPPTLALDDLMTVIKETAPRWILPMHYKTPKINLPIVPLDEFLRLADRGGLTTRRMNDSSFDIDPAMLPDTPTVAVLDHAR